MAAPSKISNNLTIFTVSENTLIVKMKKIIIPIPIDWQNELVKAETQNL